MLHLAAVISGACRLGFRWRLVVVKEELGGQAAPPGALLGKLGRLCCRQAVAAWLVRVCSESCVRGERESRSEKRRRASKDACP